MSGRPSRRSRTELNSGTMPGSLSLADLSSDAMENILQQLERDASGKTDCKSMREACDNMKQLARVYKVVVPCDDPNFWKARCTENDWLFGSKEYVPIDTKGGPDSLDRWQKQYHLFCKIANYENENEKGEMVDGTFHLRSIRKLGSFNETTEEINEIDEGAFKNCRHLRLTHLPDGIKSIHHRTFQGCRYLTLSNGLPESVTYIGGDSFYGCMRLNFDHLPTNLAFIAPGAFSYCKNLVLSGPFPSQVPRIQDYTFENCTRLALPALPPNLLSVGSKAFFYCQSLRLTRLPDTITFVRECGFAGCKNMALTKLPEDLHYIGEYAFQHCESLQFTDFPDKLKTHSENPIIKPYAFEFCNEPVLKLADALYEHLMLNKTNYDKESVKNVLGEDPHHPLSSNQVQRRHLLLRTVLFFSEFETKIAMALTLKELEILEREFKVNPLKWWW